MKEMTSLQFQHESDMEKKKSYYTSQKFKLLKEYDKALKYSIGVLPEYLDENEIDDTMKEMRTEFENLIPEIPFIGGKKNKLTWTLVESTMALAIYRVLKKKGLETDVIGEIFLMTVMNRAMSVPSILRRLFGWYRHTSLGKRSMKNLVKNLNSLPYPDN